MTHTFRLLISCPDRTGIVAAVSAFIANHNGSIIEADYHSDTVTGWFFMRQEILADSLSLSQDEFRKQFKKIADTFGMNWTLNDSSKKKKVAILVSKQDHCLADLLYRCRTQDFSFDIPCVISNHDTHRDFVEWHGIQYHHIDFKNQTKTQAFAEIESLFVANACDIMVLARFMQILPQKLCEDYSGRVINIHHSFLPSFVGERPYHKAYERGVKLVGATCHFATSELDAGPIIEQNVMRIDHGHSVEDMIRLGKDVEKNVLAHGLRYHIEDRVIIHQNKTVVFK